MPRRRLAVALLLPDELAAEVEGLRRGLGHDRRRVAPHVTLVPPVNVREPEVVDALAVLRAAAAAVRPFDLELGPIATFEPVTPVVYLAVGGDVDVLAALRAGLFVEPLARQVDRPFVPHVTVGEGLPPERIATVVAALVDFDALCPVRDVTLLEEGAPGPRRWNPIAEVRLGS